MWGFSPNSAPRLPYLCRLLAFLLGFNPFDLLDIVAFSAEIAWFLPIAHLIQVFCGFTSKKNGNVSVTQS
jgi:hypothetical protein